MSTEYRIEFSITRCQDGEVDFAEVGFGSSGGWGSVDQACHMAASAIQSREWETLPGMPSPLDVDTSSSPTVLPGETP